MAGQGVGIHVVSLDSVSVTTVLAHLQTFDADRLARLLLARPDLLKAGSLEDIARVAPAAGSSHEAVGTLPAPERQVLEALSLLPRGATLQDLQRLDPAADPVALSHVLEELQTRLLVGGGPALQIIGMARQYVDTPLGLGRSIVACFEQTPYYDLCEVLARYDEPRPRSGLAAREALALVHGDPGALSASLEELPADVLALLRTAERDGPVLRLPGVDPAMGLLPPVPGLLDAVLLGLLAVVGVGRVELPREIGLALRWPSIVRFSLSPAVPATIDVRPEDVAAAAAGQVQGLLDAIDAVGAAVAARPIPLLGSGGVGLKELRALSVGVGDPAFVSLVLRLMEGLGLVSGPRKDLRVTKAWSAWTNQSDAERWTDLVRAWLVCHSQPAVRPGTERKLKAALAWDYDHRPLLVRRQLAQLLGAADGGHHEGGWLELWRFRWPERRLSAYDGRGYLLDAELRADVLAEAEYLGLLAAGAASPLAVAVYRGDEVGEVLETISDSGEQRVRAQADMTLICTGRPARGMRVALDRIAQVEQAGAATVWRISEQSLSRAYDDGDEPAAVQAVLDLYAGEVPQAMAYLVKDAHRRHGRVRVGAATAYVVVDDDVQLQDALARRGAAAKAAKAISLRRVAPGVAVSKGTVAATLAALKELGLSALAETGAAARAPVKTTSAGTSRLLAPLPVLDLGPQARQLAARLAGG
jgi:hypothetical protein